MSRSREEPGTRRHFSPAVTAFLDVVAELIVRDLLTHPEGGAEATLETKDRSPKRPTGRDVC